MKRIVPFTIALLIQLMAPGCTGHDDTGTDGHDHGAHAAHDHAEHAEHVDEEPAGHGRTAPIEDPHDGHGHGETPAGTGVTLDADGRRIAGIRMAELEWKKLSRTVDLPGRIGFNEDRLVHVTPRFGGVVRELRVAVGARVAAGDVLAVLENNGTMARYEVTSPIGGRIIEKHAAMGELIDGGHIFVLADLARVWVNCDAYPADIDELRTGMTADIGTVDGTAAATTARIGYIAPAFNTTGGTALVRMVLPNDRLRWRPGMFVRARVRIPGSKTVATVQPAAVQVIDDETVVFVPGPHDAFFARPVVTGRRSPEGIEIKRGLGPGERYVAAGAYELKATLLTSGMDPHAGHGH